MFDNPVNVRSEREMLDQQIEHLWNRAETALDAHNIGRYDALCAEIAALEQERMTCQS